MISSELFLASSVIGLIPLAYAAFRIGGGASATDRPVLVSGILGLLSAAVLGLVGGLIVGGGFYLLGKGVRVEGGRGVVLVLAGTAVLATPILLIGLFYLASQAA